MVIASSLALDYIIRDHDQAKVERRALMVDAAAYKTSRLALRYFR